MGAIEKSTDAYYKNGTLHPICEDYVLHGTEPVPYVILADGCSSSENTEFGARVLAFQARKYLHVWESTLGMLTEDHMARYIIHGAENFVQSLGLDRSCLDATLLVAYLSPVDNFFYVRVFGDGNFVVKQDDMITWYNIQYISNAPYYLSYWLDPMRQKTYSVQFLGEKRLEYTVLKDGEVASRDHKFEGAMAPSEFSFFRGERESGIYLMSDGVESFNNSVSGDPIDPLLIVNSLTKFKSHRGEFIKRRAKRAGKSWLANDLVHYDDLSIGGIHIIEGESA